MRVVPFTASDDAQGFLVNRAVQLGTNGTLDMEDCVFDGWHGGTVIYNLHSASGSLVLDSCEFGGSSAAMAIVSPYSDAQVRNAVVTSFTYF